MPTLREALNNLTASQKNIFDSVVEDLLMITDRAKTESNNLKGLIDVLATVHQEDDLFNVVESIVSKENEMHAFLYPFLYKTNDKLLKIIKEYFADNVQYTDINNLLNFNNILSTHIIAAKERLSLQKMVKSLPKGKQDMALKFVERVKRLGAIAEEINQQKLYWKSELESADTMETVENIERHIHNEHLQISKMYGRLLPMPEDEQVAEVVIQYLQDNPSVLNIMETFDYDESLFDDIVNAKSELNANSSVKLDL